MASSGWQGEKLIRNQPGSSYAKHYANLSISSIAHSGSTVTISGVLRFILRSSSSSSYPSSWGYNITASPTGSSSLNFGQSFSNFWSGKDTTKDLNFTSTISAASSVTSLTFNVVWTSTNNSSYGSNTTSWTLSIPAGGTAPAAPTISVASITDTSATFAVACSDYGDPASDPDRGLHAAIFDINTNYARTNSAIAVSSANITVDNTCSGALQITPNTTYHYYAEADNTVLQTPSHSPLSSTPTILMLPAYISNVVVADDGHNNMTITVQHAAEGSDDTVYTEYSYDQTTWTAVQEEFHLTINSSTTVYLRRENTTGTTPVYAVNIVPFTSVKLYGSVNSQAKEIHKLYGSVGGQSKRIRKLYGSVNGRSKLIYEDNS